MPRTAIRILTTCLVLTLCMAAQAANTNSDGATVYLTHGATWSAVSTANADAAQLAAIGAQDATAFQQSAEAQLVHQPCVLYDPLLPPEAPDTVAPGDGATGVDTTPLLDWTDAPRAARYDLYAWRSSQAKPAAPSAAGHIDSQYQSPTTLLQSTSYSWQLTARNLWGQTDSPVFVFTTTGPQVPSDANHWTLYR